MRARKEFFNEVQGTVAGEGPGFLCFGGRVCSHDEGRTKKKLNARTSIRKEKQSSQQRPAHSWKEF